MAAALTLWRLWPRQGELPQQVEEKEEEEEGGGAGRHAPRQKDIRGLASWGILGEGRRYMDGER